jgi:hypothetical protein
MPAAATAAIANANDWAFQHGADPSFVLFWGDGNGCRVVSTNLSFRSLVGLSADAGPHPNTLMSVEPPLLTNGEPLMWNTLFHPSEAPLMKHRWLHMQKSFATGAVAKCSVTWKLCRLLPWSDESDPSSPDESDSGSSSNSDHVPTINVTGGQQVELGYSNVSVQARFLTQPGREVAIHFMILPRINA